MKICPKCQRTWPAQGRFCPMDGSPLQDVKAMVTDDDLPTIAHPTVPATPVAKATRKVRAVKEVQIGRAHV